MITHSLCSGTSPSMTNSPQFGSPRHHNVHHGNHRQRERSIVGNGRTGRISDDSIECRACDLSQTADRFGFLGILELVASFSLGPSLNASRAPEIFGWLNSIEVQCVLNARIIPEKFLSFSRFHGFFADFRSPEISENSWDLARLRASRRRTAFSKSLDVMNHEGFLAIGQVHSKPTGKSPARSRHIDREAQLAHLRKFPSQRCAV
jgi:hypothetical protein